MMETILDIGRGMLACQTPDGEYELKDVDGEVIVEGKWDFVFRADEGIALAFRRCRAYYFNCAGRLLQEGDWLLSGCFSEGLAVSGGRDGLYYFDTSGRVVLRPDSRWREAQGFHEGLAAVAEGDPHRHRWGYIDRRGELVIEPKWEMAGDFSGGLAVVGRNRRFTVIDRNGRELVPPDMQYYPPEERLRELREGM